MLKKLFGFHDIAVTGDMTVAELQHRFEESFGTQIRVYKPTAAGKINTGRGSRPAEPEAALASICTAGGEPPKITIRKSHTVEAIEKEFEEKMGIGVQIMTPDGTGFAPNYMKLKDVPDIPGKG